MSAPEDDDMVNFFVNTSIIFIIIFLMIFGLPLGLYAYKALNSWGKDNNALIENLQNKEIDKYNELSDIFLFCTYMPIKKLFFCNNTINTTEQAYISNHKNQISRILEILKEKQSKINTDYTRIKTLSDTFINDNKVSRIKREFEEEQRLKKEAGEDGRHNSSQLLKWFNSAGSAIHNFLKLLFMLFGFIVSIISALAKNKVVTGFLIIVLVIIIALSLTKPASKSKDGKNNNGATSSNVGLSPTAIYNDILDTYKHYSEMVKNVNVDFLGTTTETEVNVDDEDYDETLYRKIRGGKRYDNLSYINLSSLDATIQTEIKNIYKIEIDADKYYNIYLPSEKFSILQTDIEWKTSNNANNEKIWDINCEAIGVQGSTSIPAFISNEGKCIINEAELKKADKSPGAPEPPTIYKTEYIK
uniref:Uncharacterized protein n=1 Tax=viral metagenome TaxID=1070528 RepID=A0A6C0IBE4_9ZZZZ